MKLFSQKNIAEFVGVVAIVASLVFVGLQLRQIGGADAAELTRLGFASFLYQNPGARKVWLDRERNLSKYRSALIVDYSGHPWVNGIQSYLAELEQKNIPLEKHSYVDW